MKLLLVVGLAVIATAQAIDIWGKPKGVECDTPDQCQAGECCVMRSAIDGLIGKRGIDDFFNRFKKGVCKPLKKEGAFCSPMESKSLFNKNIHSFGCPCDNGLECIATKKVIDKEGFKGEIHMNPKCTAPSGSGDTEQ